ncbi:cytochrome P450, partial [Lactarius akahatsu]
MVLFSLPGYVTALAAILTYFVWRIVYNLYFHSLSHFPGPKLAACSRLWLAYREIIKGESLSDLRVKLHRQYDIIAPFFSRTSILRMQDVIQEWVNVLCGALAHQFAAGDIKGQSSDLMLGFQSFGVDVIMAFCYAKNWDTTKVPDFQSDIVIASQVAIAISTLSKYSRTLVKMTRYVPMWVGKNFGSPMTRAVFFIHASLMDQIDEILRNTASLEDAPHKTVYHSLLDPDANKGRPLPSRLSLWHKALALFSAGSDTTALTATTISYHVLHNPEIQQRLPVLEEVLRYEVTAVIKEGLRMFPGGAALPLRSPAVFPDSDAFVPERWLGGDAKTLEASLVSFSKGPRSCI